MKKYKLIAIALVAFIFASCANINNDTIINSEVLQQEQIVQNTQIETTQSETLNLAFPDAEYESELSEDLILVTEKDAIISQSGAYEFSGDYNSITVNVDKDVDEGVIYLVLNSANIESESATPINIIEGKDVVIVLKEGTTNTVTQGEITTTDEEFPSGAIYSKADTAIIGSGSLFITTLYNDGINCRDDLIIKDATIVINAVSDGIVGKDLLAISNANITVDCGKDALKSSNSEDIERGNVVIEDGVFELNAGNDGISAEQTLQINDGDFKVTTGGGFVQVLNEITRGEGSGGVVQASSLLEDSMKALKGLNIIINGGIFDISSYEDAVHSDNNLTINDGIFNIISGDDALHADMDLVINDIMLKVENAYEGIEGATITINNGDIDITVLDDAINASSNTGYLKITDGKIYLTSQGDGIDSNGDFSMSGGEIVVEVNAIYSGGDSELDISGVFEISGGTITDENGNEIKNNSSDNTGNQPQLNQHNNNRPQANAQMR